MSLSMFEADNRKRLEEAPLTDSIEASAFDGFAKGTAQYTMRGFAEAGRALSMAAATGPVLYDAMVGGTEASDKYFKWHDDVFGDAVDYWTPRPGEVGMAGQVAGALLSTLPLVIASPAAAVAKTQLSTAEDLVRSGVDATAAQATGAVQGASLGFGVWLPILGKNALQRILVGGAAANVAQGMAARGISGKILEGTAAEGQFRAFDTTQLTTDVLLGLAFGTLAHLSPASRAQGTEMWNRIGEWAKRMRPDEIDALMVVRQAQHMDVDSLGGKPVDASDTNKHVARVRRALDQLGRDERVQVDDLPAPRIEADGRFDEALTRVKELAKEAERIRVEEGLPEVPKPFKAVEPEKTDTGLMGRVKRGVKSAMEALTKEDTDPLTDAVRRFVKENPDMRIRAGEDADGNVVTRSARELLDDIETSATRGAEDARLVKVAAACVLGLA